VIAAFQGVFFAPLLDRLFDPNVAREYYGDLLKTPTAKYWLGLFRSPQSKSNYSECQHIRNLLSGYRMENEWISPWILSGKGSIP
jgi:hypothetical protein